ncbi:MAG: hypothetical protein CW346_15220 [Bacillaceae bacterium]|nr:hypothetical protein [Bacillaceae bacterium]
MDLRQIDVLVATQVMEERVIDIPFIPNTVYPKTALFTDEAASEWRKWDCMFMQWLGPDDAISQEIADTASLAICLAALRAVGVEVPQDA